MAIKKITYENVKNFINEKSGGDCALISMESIGCKSPLTLQCKCGNIFYSTFDKAKSSLLICKECRNKLASEKYRLNIEDVIKYINSTGCVYVSGEYLNNTSLITMRCKCGNLFEKNFNHFKRGQQQCPECGKEKSRISKIKYNYEIVQESLSRKGYTLLENEYIDCETPMKCKCSEGHEIYIKFSHFLNNHSGCKICANNNLKGEGHWNYKGGESEVLDYFRKLLKPWKIQVLKSYNHKCFITNTKKDCVVHHLYPFKKIVEDSCKELGLPLHRKICDYPPDDFQNLCDTILSKHTVDIGVVLQRKVHNKFHSLYGFQNTTREQFNEFIKKYYPQK